ncbi:uncharacterized protein LOC129314567 isoform X2 [Prosopis cineraria]|uniref:uncharacterized protein LOC129314567 isoform X2 n=1 Tax=Prosopis cineraria TaxID=364024 RepID=UPI00240FDE04|nr:uncharacterized protein LOC129314567 isoform X2 [Prosopis cineraria]
MTRPFTLAQLARVPRLILPRQPRITCALPFPISTRFLHFSIVSNPKAPASAFSTSASCRIEPLLPLMDSQPPEFGSPAAEGEDFVHIQEPTFESLSDSMVRIDAPADATASPSRDASGPEDRRVLPDELSRNVVVLTCESSAEGAVCEVYLVGTAHVSQESCREVQAIIDFLKPQVPTMGEMIVMLKKKHNIFGVLYSWFLAKVASKLEVFPGSEFRVAYEEAIKYGGRVILGDRPVQITIWRTWRKMPLWHKTKLLYSLLFQAIFLPSPDDLNKMLKEMDDVDMLTLVIQEMSKEFPTLMETLVHERDQYMSSSLLKVARENSSVVAVVGKGHLQGIKKHWKQPVMVKDLMTIPSSESSPSAVKIISSVGVAVAGVAIIAGIYLTIRK